MLGSILGLNVLFIFFLITLDVSDFYLSYAKSKHRLFGFEFICLLFLVFIGYLGFCKRPESFK